MSSQASVSGQAGGSSSQAGGSGQAGGPSSQAGGSSGQGGGSTAQGNGLSEPNQLLLEAVWIAKQQGVLPANTPEGLAGIIHQTPQAISAWLAARREKRPECANPMFWEGQDEQARNTIDGMVQSIRGAIPAPESISWTATAINVSPDKVKAFFDKVNMVDKAFKVGWGTVLGDELALSFRSGSTRKASSPSTRGAKSVKSKAKPQKLSNAKKAGTKNTQPKPPPKKRSPLKVSICHRFSATVQAI
ncbi:hypothetical protein NMY22_g13887 [Coprinellus aureogranulatus]|nr:hypothetical protein NMY22_g13887 [Coprinellus aureogranulatus]